MLPNNIYTLFAEAFKKLDNITGQFMYSHLAELREVLSKILLVISYDRENGIHNLVGIIPDPKTYSADYTAAFPCPSKPAIYNASIHDNGLAPVHTKNEVIHRARWSNYTTFESA